MRIELKVSSLGAWTAYVDGTEFEVAGIWLDSHDLLEAVVKSLDALDDATFRLGIQITYGKK